MKDLAHPQALPPSILGDDCKLGLTDRQSICENLSKYMRFIYEDRCNPKKPTRKSHAEILARKCTNIDNRITGMLQSV